MVCAFAKGDFLLCVAWNGEICVLNIEEKRVLTTLSNDIVGFSSKKESATSCHFSDDQKIAVLGSSEGSLYICDLQTGTSIAKFKHVHSSTVTDVKMIENRLFSACKDGRVGIWKREIENTFVLVRKPIRPRCLRNVECAESIDSSGYVRLHTSEGAFLCDLLSDACDAIVGHISGLSPRSLFCSRVINGRLVCASVCGGSEIETRSFPLKSESVIVLEEEGHSSIVNVVKYNGDVIASAGDDGRFALWDHKEMRRAIIWQKSGHSVKAMLWREDVLYIATATTVFGWKYHRGSHIEPLFGVGVAADEDLIRRTLWIVGHSNNLIFGDSSGYVTQFDVCERKVMKRVQVSNFCLTDGSLSSQKNALYIVDTRGQLLTLDPESLEQKSEILRMSPASLTCICSSSRFVACSGDDSNHLWIISKENSFHKIEIPHHSTVVALQIFEEGGGENAECLLFSFSKDQRVNVGRIGKDLKTYVLISSVPTSIVHGDAMDVRKKENGDFEICVCGGNGLYAFEFHAKERL